MWELKARSKAWCFLRALQVCESCAVQAVHLDNNNPAGFLFPEVLCCALGFCCQKCGVVHF